MLGELFAKYGSDKQSEKHSYAATYESLLGGRRDSVRFVLEVGILGGASLRAWRDYFPQARVFGVDVDACKLIFEDRITTFVADSTKPDDLSAGLGPPHPLFDLIVDDGDHHEEKQRDTRTALWPYLKTGGVYVIEDVQWVSTMMHFEENEAMPFDLRDERPGVWDNQLCVWVKE